MFRRVMQMLGNRAKKNSPKVTRTKREPASYQLLESRQVLATFTVTNINDSGAGSLRDALTQANAAVGADTIAFAIPGAGVQTITPTSALPAISETVTIDGTTQGAANNPPLIQIKGTNAGNVSGLVVNGGNSIIRALTINGFQQNGIVLSSSGNTVDRSFIGVDSAGTGAAANGVDGIQVSGANNTIGGTSAGSGNIISGNGRHGISISGVGATANNVLGNKIGLNTSGLAAIPNGNSGVQIGAGAKLNNVGSTTNGARNIISANASFGVLIDGIGTDSNTVAANFVGTNFNGNIAIGNATGVGIRNGAKTNLIGSSNVAGMNIISGNTSIGVRIQSSGTTGNVLLGNRIGTDVSGIFALGNSLEGVLVDGAATNNKIGGPLATDGNLISGNLRNGIVISGVGTSANLVLRNSIGLNNSGIAALSNAESGIQIKSGATNNEIGGASVGNFISGNAANGVMVRNVGTTGNKLIGNTIGLNLTGSGIVANALDGVALLDRVTNNTIGSIGTFGGNTISGNRRSGIRISDPGTDTNFAFNNRIGTNSAGSLAFANPIGVWIANGAKSNTIGVLTNTDERNTISGNSIFGVALSGIGTDNNTISGNHIGTTTTGVGLLANTLDGVNIGAGAKSNTIGGTAAGSGNLISGNGRDGVGIYGVGTNANKVFGNRIGLGANGTSAIGNLRNGVTIREGAANSSIGNTASASRNFIGGNLDGIFVSGAGTNANIRNNFVGLGIDGSTGFGQSNGVRIVNGATAVIGGDVPNAGNVISGNGNGVLISGAATSGVVIQGNLIGTNSDGSIKKPNAIGILVQDEANNITIGGTDVNARNVISGNNSFGIRLQGGVQNISIQGNFIGLNLEGTAKVEQGSGVRIETAKNVTLGGTVPGARNVISGSTFEGVQVIGNNVAGADSGIRVQGNFIGLNAAGTGTIGNKDGFQISGQDEMIVIGGNTPEASNIISGNSRFGIRLPNSNGNRIQGNKIGVLADGITPAGNGSHGVFIHSNGGNNLIGGTGTGEGNLIANNGGDGVLIGSDPALGINDAAGVGNSILGNRIFGNVGQAIDLSANDSGTANDTNDVDIGPNNLLNKAALSFATSVGSATLVRGVLDSVIGNFRIEFFSGANAGQPDTLLGFLQDEITSTTDLSFAVFLPVGVAPGKFVFAIVTNLDTGDSSELSNGIVVI